MAAEGVHVTKGKDKADLNASLLKGMSILQKLAAARQACKSRETDLIKDRKGLELQIEELGTASGEEFRIYAADYYLTQRRIDFERNRQKQLADMMEKTINDSVQGTFQFEDVSERELIAAPTDEELFHKDADDEEGDGSQMKLPGAGKPGRPKPEAPDPSKGDGVDEHLNSDVKELDIDDARIVNKLVAAGLTKIGHVANIIDADDDLEAGASLSGSQAAKVRAAVKKYRKAHRQAARQVEEAAS